MYHIKKKKVHEPPSGQKEEEETSNCSMASVPCCRHLAEKREKMGWVAWTAVASLLESSVGEIELTGTQEKAVRREKKDRG